MGLFDSFRVWGLFFVFHDVLIVCLGYRGSGVRTFTVWQFVEKRRENSAFGVCMVLHGDIMVQGLFFSVSMVMYVVV